MQVPRLTKITLNMGVSEAVSDKKVMDNAVGDLTKIAGQKPVVTKSKKAIAGFKIRDDVPIGSMVTLRGVQMYEFLDRFVTVALPRVRDFRGISGRAFDGRGNYNIGVKEQIIFPGDRLRQDRRAARPEHQHHDDREDRRRVQGAAHRVQVPVQELRRATMAKLSLIQREQKRDAAGRQVRQEVRRTQGHRRTTRRSPTKSATPRASSCRSCRATPTRRASATAAS